MMRTTKTTKTTKRLALVAASIGALALVACSGDRGEGADESRAADRTASQIGHEVRNGAPTPNAGVPPCEDDDDSCEPCGDIVCGRGEHCCDVPNEQLVCTLQCVSTPGCPAAPCRR